MSVAHARARRLDVRAVGAAKRDGVEHSLMAAVAGLRVKIELLPAGHEPAGVWG